MLWIPFSILASIARAGSRLSNQYFQLPGLHLVFWTKALITLYMLPAAFLLPWPTEPWFYVFLLAQGPLAVYRDKKLFDLTATHGSGAVSRIEPLSLILLFFAWILITPDLLIKNLADPLRFTVVSVCIILMAYFSIQMRKCDISFDVFKKMIPLILVTACLFILAKSSIDQTDLKNAAFIYIFVQSVIIFIFSLTFIAKGNLKENTAGLFDIKTIWRCVFVSLTGMTVVFSRITAFRLVDNPAYVNAIIMTAPFWIILFYKLVKHEEKGDVKYGLGIVCCAIMMALFVVK